MNPVAEKISRTFGISIEAAEKLIAAGYNCSRKVRDATDEQLSAVPGVEESLLAIRVRYPDFKAR